jgi:hypothetical protein
MIEEVEQDLVGPVQVLYHQHRRALLDHRLHKPPPGRERLGLPVTAHLCVAGQADQRPQLPGDPGGLRLVVDQVGHGLGELGVGGFGRVAVQDAGLGLHDLAECPQRHPLPIGQAAALPPGDQLRLGLHQLQQLEHQPALADPRHPN